MSIADKDKINEVAKIWLGKAENITAAEEDDEVSDEEEVEVEDEDAEAKQALGDAEDAAGEIKTSVTNMAPQIGVVINRLNTAKVTEGKIKEEVEAEKAEIQKQIDKQKEVSDGWLSLRNDVNKYNEDNSINTIWDQYD